MSRFGVMKHLKVLEEAGLVTTQEARSREAALPQPRPDPARSTTAGSASTRSPGPRRSASSNTTSRRRRAMNDEQTYAVVGGRGTMTVFEIYIKTTPERLWEAITDERDAQAATASGSAPPPSGRRARSTSPAVPGVIEIASGENLEVDPPRRLVQSFNALWSEDVQREGTSRVTWEIEPVGDLLPAAGHPRPARRGRQQRTLRRLADDPLRPEDAAGDRRGPRHSRLPALFRRLVS